MTGLQVLLVHTIGSAAFETGRTQDPEPAARHRRGRERAADFGGMTADLSDPISRWSGDAVFERGLGWLLDGLVSDAASPRCGSVSTCVDAPADSSRDDQLLHRLLDPRTVLVRLRPLRPTSRT